MNPFVAICLGIAIFILVTLLFFFAIAYIMTITLVNPKSKGVHNGRTN